MAAPPDRTATAFATASLTVRVRPATVQELCDQAAANGHLIQLRPFFT